MEKALEDVCLQLGALSDEADPDACLDRFPSLLKLTLVAELAEEVRLAVRTDVKRAQCLAEAALRIARRLNTDHELALAFRAKANVDWVSGDCKSAVNLYREASTRFERIGNKNELGRTLSSSIQSFLLLGQYDQAFAAADKAKAIFLTLEESWRVARVEINRANIYHRQNRYADALKTYEQAYRQLLPHRDMEGIGVALHNMAVCLIALDDFHAAVETYERVRAFCSENEMPLLVSQADYNIAYLHYLRGDYSKALALLRSTREVCRKNGDDYHLGLCDLDQSEIYLELGLIDEATEMARNSLAQFEELGMGFESARALTNLAIAATRQNEFDTALATFSRARKITENENNPVWPNLIDLYSAIVLLEQNELDRARMLCISAATFFQSAQMPGKVVLCQLLLTRIDLQAGKLDDAQDHCNEALRILEKLDAPMLFYQASLLRGQIHEAAGRVEQAYGSYQQSRGALEILRSSLQRQELRIGLMRNRLEVYNRLVQLCLTREQSEASYEEALSYVESARSRTLRDLILGEAQPSQRDSIEGDADRELSDLRKELNWFYHRIEREQLSKHQVSSDSIEALKHEAKIRERKFLRLLLDTPDTGAVGLALHNSKTASLAEVRDALGPQTALLEYFAIGERAYVAVVTATRLHILPLTNTHVLSHRLRMLQFQFSKFTLDCAYAKKFHRALSRATHDHLHSLYNELFAPLRDMSDIRDLVIVPYGTLHSLPFHALFDGDQYLIDRFRISYAPSASIFSHIQAQPDLGRGPSLIVGVADDRTPFIHREVEAVAAITPDPKVLFGVEATEKCIRELGGCSRIIHIASHGFFRQDSPMFSSIKLADSYLTLYDLYRMNLPADLLTLSGCVTGLNVVVEGDELLGLARGLLYAGAKSLVLSLWDIDDHSATEFMREFYSTLGHHWNRVDAMRNAMLRLRESCPHPYFWAPFKLIGKRMEHNFVGGASN